MKFSRAHGLGLVMAFALNAAACSDDENNPTGTGGSNDPDIAAATSMVYEVALPLVRDIFIGGYLANPPSKDSSAGLACGTLDLCASGTAQVCVDPGSFSLTFSQCSIGSTTLAGTVSLTTEGNSGSGTMSLSAGNITIEGNISYMMAEGCFGQYFTECVITSSIGTINMAGSASWCDPYVMVDGVVIPDFAQFEFVLAGRDRLIDFSLFSEPVNEIQVLLMNASRTEIYKVCHGEFIGGGFSCAPGPDA